LETKRNYELSVHASFDNRRSEQHSWSKDHVVASVRKRVSRPELSNISRQDELVQVAQQIRVEDLNNPWVDKFIFS
jgi:hypothetical protein